MSSKRTAMSRRLMPRIAALRKTFSRPDSSGWKPAPSSSSADIRLCTRTVPEFGWRMPAMHFSSVDLPEPFWPMTPNTSPSLDVERDVVERGELVEPVAAACRR